MDPYWLYNAETDPNPEADPDAGNKKCLTVNKNSCKVNLEIYVRFVSEFLQYLNLRNKS